MSFVDDIEGPDSSDHGRTRGRADTKQIVDSLQAAAELTLIGDSGEREPHRRGPIGLPDCEEPRGRHSDAASACFAGKLFRSPRLGELQPEVVGACRGLESMAPEDLSSQRLSGGDLTTLETRTFCQKGARWIGSFPSGHGSAPVNALGKSNQKNPLLRFFETLGTAISESDQDYTKISMHRGIVLLAVPMVLEMAMESIFSLADVFFVARLGPDAVAAVGLTEALMIIVYALGAGLGIPATAMVARRIGEKDPDAAAVVMVQVNLLGLFLAVGIGFAGFFAAPYLLRAMGATEEVVAVGVEYTSLLLGSNAVILLLFLNGAVLRGAGDASAAMWALWIANGINLILDPCLIFGLGPFPELGLYGAAVATTTGRGIGVLYQLHRLTRGSGHLRIERKHLKLRPRLIVKILRLSIGAIGQNLVETASWLLLVRVVAIFGSTVLAGYTIAVRVVMFMLLPGWGVANAAATLVGQNLGAKQPDRAARSVWWCGGYVTVFLALAGGLVIIFDEEIVRVFTEDTEVVRIGADCLRIITYGMVAYGWGMVGVQSFNGAGDTLTPLWINIGSFWLVKIPLAYVLARTLGWGPDGIWFSVTVAYVLQAVLAMAVFKRGRWKERQV